MAIKILLFILGYLLIGWIVDRVISDPENPEGFCLTVIIMIIWPLVAVSAFAVFIMTMIITFLSSIIDGVIYIIRYFKKNKSDKNKCKTCLYNKSASSRPVCLECVNYSLYEPMEDKV